MPVDRRGYSSYSADQARMQPKRDESRGIPGGDNSRRQPKGKRNDSKSRQNFFLRLRVSNPEFPLHLSPLG